ncbi:phage integrase SAM-like domain-containing protein [Flavobacterium sp. GT3R68]|uniref:phage integrase SAM-like domain-containing protein n=1 Tax=Flavobacterium sp. GT3R68 TaxID=2594437 RepID=UPI000F85C8C1|nr:phage integrase SAM-like domain-containing protein [Flavobacterium sp. GT3R68]RTY89323.1 integrase [Flavobacterium sp. GSN2]TRW93883.1 site-specific integrase [Flavobacterium sp. GT3R68]
MATIQYRLRSKANKNVSIKIRLSINRDNVFELNTGFTINPNNWSEPNGLPKQTLAENKRLSNNLKKLETFVLTNLNTDLGKSVLIDALWLETKINDCFERIEKTDTGLIVNYIQDIIDNASTRKVKIKGGHKLGLSKSRENSFISTKSIISEYQTKTKKQIHFIDINETLIDKFTNWLIKTKKYAVNTASKHIANIKTISIEAEKKGIQVNPFAKQITIFSERDEDRFIQTLSFEELEIIRTADIKGEAYNNARKWVLFGCEIGQRGGDLMDITKENIRYSKGNMYLDIIQQKTKKEVTIGIKAPHVIDIIENSFPYKISTQKLNLYIKEVCKIAKIETLTEGKIFDAKTGRKELKFYEKHKLITSHSFRRSFATNYYKIVPTAVLIGITGHSKESLFLTYINKSEDKDSNADLFMKFYETINKDKKPEMKLIKNGTDN